LNLLLRYTDRQTVHSLVDMSPTLSENIKPRLF